MYFDVKNRKRNFSSSLHFFYYGLLHLSRTLVKRSSHDMTWNTRRFLTLFMSRKISQLESQSSILLEFYWKFLKKFAQFWQNWSKLSKNCSFKFVEKTAQFFCLIFCRSKILCSKSLWSAWQNLSSERKHFHCRTM